MCPNFQHNESMFHPDQAPMSSCLCRRYYGEDSTYIILSMSNLVFLPLDKILSYWLMRIYVKLIVSSSHGLPSSPSSHNKCCSSWGNKGWDIWAWNSEVLVCLSRFLLISLGFWWSSWNQFFHVWGEMAFHVFILKSDFSFSCKRAGAVNLDMTSPFLQGYWAFIWHRIFYGNHGCWKLTSGHLWNPDGLY